MKKQHIHSVVRKNLMEAPIAPSLDNFVPTLDNIKNKAKEFGNDVYKKVKGMDSSEIMNNFKNSAKNAKSSWNDFLKKLRTGTIDYGNTETAAPKVSTGVSRMLSKSKSGMALMQDSEFVSKLNDVASDLNVEPADLLRVFGKETGGTFDPKAQNRVTRATGLLQFMPSTAKRLGTSVEALQDMSAAEQMDYVKRYFEPYKNNINGYEDLYLVTFFPAAVGKSDDYVFRTKKTSAELISRQNPVIARAAGKQPGEPLTVGDFKRYCRS